MRELRGKESTRHRADKRGEEDCWIPSLGRPAPYSSLGASRRIIALRHRGFSIRHVGGGSVGLRSEEHTSELQSLMRISYAVFCLKKKKKINTNDKKSNTSQD